MFKKKVYVLEGYTWEPGAQYPLGLQKMVFAKYRGAYDELMSIVSSIMEEADEMGWKIETRWVEGDWSDTFEIKYLDRDTIDNFIIYEREVIR